MGVIDRLRAWRASRWPGRCHRVLRPELAIPWLEPTDPEDLDAAGAAVPGPSLLDLEPGDEATVESLAGGSPRRLGRLSGYGLAPGTCLRLVQRSPAVVIEVGGTRLALEAGVAAAIRVAPRRGPGRETGR